VDKKVDGLVATLGGTWADRSAHSCRGMLAFAMLASSGLRSRRIAFPADSVDFAPAYVAESSASSSSAISRSSSSPSAAEQRRALNAARPTSSVRRPGGGACGQQGREGKVMTTLAGEAGWT
jgi:hypothetical protein